MQRAYFARTGRRTCESASDSQICPDDDPRKAEKPFQIQLAPPNNIDVKGQTQVYVDRECPVILTAVDGAIPTGMEIFRAAMFPLHANLMLGTFGSAIVFLAGLILPFSFVTGVLLWLEKRKNAQASHVRLDIACAGRFGSAGPHGGSKQRSRSRLSRAGLATSEAGARGRYTKQPISPVLFASGWPAVCWRSSHCRPH